MNFDKIELGTPETAVKSCVNLLSRLFEQPEEYVACYLDLYYQVRRRWEESEAPSGAARQLPQGGSQGERVPPSKREGDREAVEGVQTGTAEAPSGAARQLPQRGSQGERVPPSKREGDREAVEGVPTDAAETPSGAARQLPQRGSQETKKKRDPASYANTAAHNAAVYKRAVRERFMAARQDGLSTPQVLAAAEGRVQEADVWKIIKGHQCGVDVYRELEKALARLSL